MRIILSALALLLSAVAAHAGTATATLTTSYPPAYSGPCDVVSGGCAEAYSMTRAMASSYSGPLFQVALFSNSSSTMDVPQSSNRTANMSGVLAFCGGTYSNCAISKMYAQIQGHANDLNPDFMSGHVDANSPANCGDRGSNTVLSCACPLTIDATSGDPINPLNTTTNVTPNCEYIIGNEATATGINAGTNSISIVAVEQSAHAVTQCCSTVGVMHAIYQSTTLGTDFGIGIQYGRNEYVSCPTSTEYCLMIDEESNSSPSSNSLGTSQLYAVAMAAWNSSTNILTGTVNGHQAWTPQAPEATQDTGDFIHVGGGGDGSQPASGNLFEFFVTNTAMSSADYSNVFSNVEAAYPSITFP